MMIHAAHETEDLDTNKHTHFGSSIGHHTHLRQQFHPFFTISHHHLPRTRGSGRRYLSLDTNQHDSFGSCPPSSQSFLRTLYRHESSSSTNLRRKSTKIILLAQTFRSPLVGLASRSLFRWYYRSRCLHLAPGLALQLVTDHTIASSRKLVATPAFGLQGSFYLRLVERTEEHREIRLAHVPTYIA